MAKNKFSFSRIKCFEECAKKFKFRYIDKYYPIKTASALFFGSAIDEVFNYALASKQTDKDLDIDQLWEEYDKMMTKTHPNDILYYNSDVSLYVLNDDDINKFILVDPEFREMCLSTQKKQLDYVKWFKENHPIEFNALAWISLYRKGVMMVETFISDVLPLFDEITSIQDELKVDNGEGDILTCIIDFTTKTKLNKILENPNTYINPDLLKKLDLEKSHNIVMDNKTSSQPYLKTSVETSEQLSLYNDYYDTNLCGYVVFHKKIKKSKIMSYQIIIGEVDKEFQQVMFDTLAESVHEIKTTIDNNKFEKNTQSCYSYGRKCDYYNLCFNNNNEGLKKRKIK